MQDFSQWHDGWKLLSNRKKTKQNDGLLICCFENVAYFPKDLIINKGSNSVLSTSLQYDARPRAVKNKKKLGGSAAMQGGLWACTQRPFDLSVNNSMILAIDLSPSSHIGMKLPVNTGVVKKMKESFVPMSVPEPIQWVNLHKGSTYLTWMEQKHYSIIANMFVSQELSLIFIRQDGPGLAWYSRDSFPVGISAILEFLKI